MNILLLLAHSIEEYDQIRLLTGLGYDVFSLGGYIDPAHPHDDKRPALPDAPFHPDLKAIVDGLGTGDNLKHAKEHIPDGILDWADTIIVHHYEHTWLWPQWDRLRTKRVIWRTVGQSVEANERLAAPFRRDGLQIVRYSPRERNIPGYAGEDALIRFYKDPADFIAWQGDMPVVVNVTQKLRQRHPYTNWQFWEDATGHLPEAGVAKVGVRARLAVGPGSEEIGGTGQVTTEQMYRILSRARAYLYTGTQPASYTLGFIEAMMAGIPIVSIGASHMAVFPYGNLMFEAHELAWRASDDPKVAARYLDALLADSSVAFDASQQTRKLAVEMFGRRNVAVAWKAFLG